jgi:hypothetical protein
MELTKELARTIILDAANGIETELDSLVLDQWGHDLYGDTASDLASLMQPSCGMPACIGGHIAWNAQKRGFKSKITYIGYLASLVVNTAELSDDLQADKWGNWPILASDSSNWPEPWSSDFEGSDAERAVGMLRALVADAK